MHSISHTNHTVNLNNKRVTLRPRSNYVCSLELSLETARAFPLALARLVLRLMFDGDRHLGCPVNPVEPLAVVDVRDDASQQRADDRPSDVIIDAWDKPASAWPLR